MKFKYTNDEIQQILDPYGVKALEYISTKNVIAVDSCGYKYKIVLTNLLNREKLPHRYRGNPFALYNLSVYLKQNGSSLMVLSSDYSNCNKKIELLCPKHLDKGIQYKTLDYLLNKNCNCKYCNREEVSATRRISNEIVSSRCDELGLTYIGQYTDNGETKVKFRCNKHVDKGVQTISWYHLKTCALGCSFCAGKHKTNNDFINEMKLINPYIEIIGEYNGSELPVECKCRKCGYKWSPIGRSLKYGQGCPVCKSSKGERKIEQFLKKSGVSFICQKTFDDCKNAKKLRFDFYLPDFNIAIEYDGAQHYMPIDFAGKGNNWARRTLEETKKKDGIKDRFCNEHGICLIRIPYWEIQNTNNILGKNINRKSQNP